MRLEPLLMPLPFTLICLAFGLLVGSFLNVVIYRLPKMMEREWSQQYRLWRGEAINEERPFNLALPGSHCPACGHRLALWENIPLVSFLLLKGQCRDCKSRIGWRYPLIETTTGLLFASIAHTFGPSGATAGLLVFAACLIALSFIDLDTFLLPDSLTLALLWLGLLLNLDHTYTDPSSAIIGAIAGYLALWLVFWGFKLATDKEGMGYGDFKLLAAIGAWMGWQVLPLVILLSSIAGAVVGVTLVALGRHARTQPIPFGPYLAIAGMITVFIGREDAGRLFGL
jgi:leader peptidase (prepilin peptidase)/N-methyltransferase